ncbi:MAG: M16 family metallopeptidase [Candidatus Eisenbacteria bacterium]|nr:pitrilysin family protein [Candidatus Eisenbacteria bacterium]
MRFIRKLDRVRPIEEVKKAVLPNGLTILVEEVPQVHSLSIGVWVRTGSRDEPDSLAGITHFIEHMVFKGTRRRNALQIAKKMETVGGYLDAFTSREHTCYYARVFEEHLDVAMEILGDLLCCPRFEREMIDRERGVVIEEIESYENNPEEQLHDLVSETVWSNHPLGRPILGTREAIARFGTRTLRAYHQEHYTAPNVVVAASGHVSFENVVSLAQRHLALSPSASPNGSVPLPRFRSRAVHFEKEVTQVSLSLAGRGPSCYAEDRHALAVVNMILGAGLSSRLFQRIREEEGIAYTVYSFLDVLVDTGLFGIYFGVAPENAQRSLQIACKEIRKLKKEGIKRWELESAKAQLLMSHFLSYESTYDRMNQIAQSEIYYGKQPDLASVLTRVQAIDRDEVQAAIERYLQPQRFSAVALGPAGARYPEVGEWDF